MRLLSVMLSRPALFVISCCVLCCAEQRVTDKEWSEVTSSLTVYQCAYTAHAPVHSQDAIQHSATRSNPILSYLIFLSIISFIISLAKLHPFLSYQILLYITTPHIVARRIVMPCVWGWNIITASQPASPKLLFYFFAPNVPSHRFHTISNLFCLFYFSHVKFFETKVIASELK